MAEQAPFCTPTTFPYRPPTAGYPEVCDRYLVSQCSNAHLGPCLGRFRSSSSSSSSSSSRAASCVAQDAMAQDAIHDLFSGQVKTSAGFSFDVANEEEESEIVRENNGGLILRRGFSTFQTCSLFSGCVFRVNLTTGNLTANGTFTASGASRGFIAALRSTTSFQESSQLL